MIRKVLATSVLIIVIASMLAVGGTLATTRTASAKAAAGLTPASTAKPSQTTTIPNLAVYTGPFIGNKSGPPFYHVPSCPEAQNITPKNLAEFPSAQAAIAAGWQPCPVCRPETYQ